MRRNAESSLFVVALVVVQVTVFSLAVVQLCGCAERASAPYFSPGYSQPHIVGRAMLGGRIASALDAEYRDQRRRTEPPLALETTDGEELELDSVVATVKIDGPLAHTELHLTFHNPEGRIREGRFSLVVPDGATVDKLDMMVNGQWRRSRVVSREKGREVFETLLERRIDPALLEQDLGNRFSARIYPIFANERKQIVVGYDQRISDAEPYVLPLAGLAPTHELEVVVEQDGVRREVDTYGGDLVVPVRGGTLALAELGAAPHGSRAGGAGRAFVARIDAPVATSAAPFDSTFVLVDTSASRSQVMARQADFVRAFLAKLPEDSQVIIATFDNDVREVYRGPARQVGSSLSRVLGHGALGGSNLGTALAHAAASGASRIVLVGDGVPTLGEHDPKKLAALVRGKVTRIDAIQIGASIDRDTLAALVRAGSQTGVVVDGRDRARAMRQLSMTVPREQPIRVAGASATWPASTRGLAPGEPVWVYGLRDSDGPLSIRIGDRDVTVVPKPAKTDLRRTVARAEVAALTERLATAAEQERPAIGKQIETIALAHHLVSSQTSLIVLENDGDELAYLGSLDHDESTAAGPTIDAGSTKQGITLTSDYTRNIPTGRTFQSVLGTAAGSQADSYGISFSGATTHENVYVVEGIDSTSYGELIVITEAYDACRGPTAPCIRANITTPFVQDLVADKLNSSAFAMRALPAPRRASSYHRYKPDYGAPHDGKLAEVMTALANGQREPALELASEWQLANPTEVAAILALGEALEARGAFVLAARAYASLVDLYPGQVELVRTAAQRLDRVAAEHAPVRELAIDAYRRALRDRPDHATTYRLLAWSLVRANRLDEALDVLGQGIVHPKLGGGAVEILAREAGLVGAAIVARQPTRHREIATRMRYGLPSQPSLHVVMSWETDANDVDLIVTDRNGGRASAKAGTAPGTGGTVSADVANGYGPERFAVDKPSGYPYKVAAHYYNKGPMGMVTGTVQIIRHDGHGTLTVEDRPFAIQNDHAMIDLGSITAP